jgi:hypothetical protein
MRHMVLKVRKLEDFDSTIFMLSGRIEERHLQELRELVEADARLVNRKLDLEEVKLVDRKVIEFLADCEAAGIELRNCPPYVRVWIDTGRDIGHES